MLLDTAHPDLHKQFLHSTPVLLKATQFHNHRYLAHSVGLRSSSAVPCEQWFLQAGRYGTRNRGFSLSRSVRPGETTARKVVPPGLSKVHASV